MSYTETLLLHLLKLVLLCDLQTLHINIFPHTAVWHCEFPNTLKFKVFKAHWKSWSSIPMSCKTSCHSEWQCLLSFCRGEKKQMPSEETHSGESFIYCIKTWNTLLSTSFCRLSCSSAVCLHLWTDPTMSFNLICDTQYFQNCPSGPKVSRHVS